MCPTRCAVPAPREVRSAPSGSGPGARRSTMSLRSSRGRQGVNEPQGGGEGRMICPIGQRYGATRRGRRGPCDGHPPAAANRLRRPRAARRVADIEPEHRRSAEEVRHVDRRPGRDLHPSPCSARLRGCEGTGRRARAPRGVVRTLWTPPPQIRGRRAPPVWRTRVARARARSTTCQEPPSPLRRRRTRPPPPALARPPSTSTGAPASTSTARPPATAGPPGTARCTVPGPGRPG